VPVPNEIIPIERQQRILEIADEHGVVRVNELSKLFAVSVMTIRRDLVTLEEQGLLRRSHGGAVSRRRFQRESNYDQKGKRNRSEKEAIGRLAATLIEPGETILVNSGSTTLELLRHLPEIELRVITSNAGAVSALMSSRIECIVLGGVYRHRSNSFVGAFAVQTLDNVYGSKAFIGVDGLDLEAGLTTPHHQEAEIARQMIRRTRGEVVILADSSKIGGVSPFITTSLDPIDIIITDTGIADEYRSALEERDIAVLLADLDEVAESHTADLSVDTNDGANAT